MEAASVAGLSADAVRAAAALVAALQQPAPLGAAQEAVAAALGSDVVHCSIAVAVEGGGDGGTICSSGNLLQTQEVRGSCFSALLAHCGGPQPPAPQPQPPPVRRHLQASSLHCAATSLAGGVMTQQLPRLLHGRLPR